MLLDLPPELVQLVLLKATTPAFLQAAFSCRALYEIAINCREALIYHLQHTPGVDSSSISSLNTKQLFQVLKTHAYRQLLGAQFYADCMTYEPVERVLNVRASSLVCVGDQVLAFIVYRDYRTVHVFRVVNEHLRFETQLKLPWDHTGQVEVLKTSFDGEDGIYVLQRFTPSMDEHDPEGEHPFVKQAMQSSASIYLSRHSLQNPDEPAQLCAFPDHDDWEPSGLAIADEETFAIAWRHTFYYDYEVLIYTDVAESGHEPTFDAIDLTYTTRLLVSHNANRRLESRGPIIDLAFNDRSSQLLYYYPTQGLYGSFQTINSAVSPDFPKLYENTTPVRFSESLSLLFSIGVPFFGTHETQNNDGLETCRWRYLALGIATHRKENWTVACLLKSEAVCRSHNCGHVLQLERGRRLTDWVVAARLWGFRDTSNSSGCRVATSKNGSRIAIANWNVVYIWAAEPSALIELNESGCYPSSSRSASTGLIELQPIVLPMEAVCFQLCFTDQENELVAVTDRGIMVWNLSPGGRNRRVRQGLEVK